MFKIGHYISCKTVLFLLLFSFLTQSFSQTVYLPYRVGNKFGIGDENGKMIIKPQFDFIETAWESNSCFFGYTITDSFVLSSLIYNNKIIISRQKYSYYFAYKGLFLAYEYSLINKNLPVSGNNIKERNDLYNTDGIKVVKGNFRDINVYNELDREGEMNEVLLYTEDVKQLYSLHVYNRKIKKIVRTYFSKSNTLEVDHHLSRNYLDTSITFVYRDAAGKGREIKISKKGKAFVKVSDKAVVIRETENEYYDRSEQHIVGEGYRDGNERKPPKSGDSIILKAKRVEIQSSSSYLYKKAEEIIFTAHTFDIKDRYLVLLGGKYGLKDSRPDTFILQPVYDEILSGEMHPQHGGYILRNGDLYGLFLYNYPKDITIAPVFDKIPLVENVNYFKKGSPLIKLYDANGKLFCYANAQGKMFYSEN